MYPQDGFELIIKIDNHVFFVLFRVFTTRQIFPSMFGIGFGKWFIGSFLAQFLGLSSINRAKTVLKN